MQTLTIAIATWREAIRQPVSIIILFVAAVMTFLSQFLDFYQFDPEAGKNVIRQMAVAQTMMCGMVIAVFTASAVLAEEIENLTILTLLAKPVRRYQVIVGKFLGIMLTVLAAFLVMVAVSLATAWWKEADLRGETQIEKRRGNPTLAVTELPTLATGQGTLQVADSYTELITARGGHGLDYLQSLGDCLMLWTGQTTSLVARAPLGVGLKKERRGGRLPPSQRWAPADSPGIASITANVRLFLSERTGLLLQAFVLAFTHVMVVAAIAVALSTRVQLALTALVCSAVFIVGNVSMQLAQTLTESGAEASGWAARILAQPVIWLCYLMPDFRVLSLMDEVATGYDHVEPGAWLYGALYGIVYSLVVLFIAVLLFRRREVT